MNRLLLFLFLTLSLQSFSKADDIRDFEIEGMSIGDSLLDYYNQNEINKNYWPNSKKYYYSYFKINNSNSYDEVQIIIKDNDKRYIIQSIRAGKVFPDKIDQCLQEKDKLVNEFKEIVGNNIIFDNYPKYQHSDNYPNSFIYSTQVELKNNNIIRIYCTDWSSEISKKNGWKDNLSLSMSTSNYRKFLSDEAFN